MRESPHFAGCFSSPESSTGPSTSPRDIACVAGEERLGLGPPDLGPRAACAATVSPFTSARGVPSRVGPCELNWRRPVLAAALVSSCLCRGTGRRNEFQVSAKELTERTELRPREAIATRKRDRAVSLWRKAETVMNLVLETTGQQAVNRSRPHTQN